jgi:pentatricopeptide repeat protein
MTRSQIPLFLSPTFSTRTTSSPGSKGKFNIDETHRCLLSTNVKMDSCFIDTLVLPCACQQQTCGPFTYPPVKSSPFVYHKARRRNAQMFFQQTRSMQTLQIKSGPPASQPSFSRDDYLRMLDFYPEPAPVQSLRQDPNPSDLALSWPAVQTSQVLDEMITTVPEATTSEEHIAIERLVSLLEQSHSPPEAILEAYSALPSPGVAYLAPYNQRLLFRRLSTVENKTVAGMVRYLAVVDDMKAANLPMTEAEWNSALAFTGRCFSPVRAAEVESALQIWKEMEQNSKVQSGEVTFNILFDIAVKAGKYVLAEMILKEMRARNLPLNRFARTGIIYFHGLQGDGEAVREAYKAFVDAGEIVDTVVMNCVIVSLLRAGEPQAAELVYERMKCMHLSMPSAPRLSYYHWRHSRELGRILDRAACDLRSGSEQHRKLQDEQLLCPNLRTYAIFIEYHVTQTGELRRIVALLEEMQALGVPMHGRIFVKIFKGFAKHGRVRYTSWTGPRLEKVWASLRAVLECQSDDRDDMYLGKWMVVWAMRAFDQCCGRGRAMDIWAELSSRWKLGRDEEIAVFTLLNGILRDRQDVRTQKPGCCDDDGDGNSDEDV